MALIPDLVQVSKLETHFYVDPNCTQHVRYTFGNTSRKKIREEEQWRREKDIGCGGGGVVWLERCLQSGKERNVRAVKKIRKVDSSTYYRELEAMALFSHSKYEPCFVKFFGWYENSDSIFIAMEYLLDGDLHQYLGSPLAEKEGQDIVFQILEGLQFMHDSGFVHRDLKPANILVQHKGPNWWVKIGDFGISKRASESWTRIGTPAFAAPEVFRSGRSGDSYTSAVDIWSLGVITFFILTGEILFKDSYRLDQYVDGGFEFPSSSLLANQISKQGHDFIQNSMAPKPENRLGVKECLQHSWLISFMEGFTPETPSKIDSSEATTTQPGDSSPEPSASWSTQVPLSTYESDRPPKGLAEKTSQEVIAHSTAEPLTQVYLMATGILKGHLRPIYDVKFSPNGKEIVSASSDQTIRIWNSATGTTRDVLRGHSDVVWHVAFSPNGEQIASASSDKTIKLWDSITGSLRNTLEGHSDEVWGVTFSSDGEMIASASADETLRIWDSVSGTTRDILRGHSDGVWDVTFSPNGEQIASASSDQTIILWDSVAKRPDHILKGHTGVVGAVTFSPNGELVASASFDKTVMIWNSSTGTLFKILKGHSEAIRSLTFSPDGKQIASASMDQTIRLWDSVTNTTRILSSHLESILSVAFSPDGGKMVSASTDKTIVLWQSVRYNPVMRGPGASTSSRASKGLTASRTNQD